PSSSRPSKPAADGSLRPAPSDLPLRTAPPNCWSERGVRGQGSDQQNGGGVRRYAAGVAVKRTDTTWRNWAGIQRCAPVAVEHPSTESELTQLVKTAATAGHPVKVVGA